MTFRGVPDRIGRYQILSELGRGSMGHVYLALDPNIERRIALKVLLPLLKVGLQEEAELRQRFLVEARAAGKLKHPGVVTLFDADTDSETGFSFIAMEWIDGPSLHDLIRESGTLPIPKALRIVEQVAVALDAAHRADLVHRDIKPANILLDAGGQAKVTDFGIAKLASMSITATGWIPGSPYYMSPEQVRGEDLDGRSDLYSLGVALYQCLTGEVPFCSDSLASMTYMILEVDPRPPQPLNPDISDSLAALVETAMEKSPEDRFQSGFEFAQAVRSVASDTAWVGGKTAPRKARREKRGATGDDGTVLLPTDTAVPDTPQRVLSSRRRTRPKQGGPIVRLGRSWSSISPLTRYSMAALALLLLVLIGPALRTLESQRQLEAAPLQIKVTSPTPLPTMASQPSDRPSPFLTMGIVPPELEKDPETVPFDPPLEEPGPVQEPARQKRPTKLPVKPPVRPQPEPQVATPAVAKAEAKPEPEPEPEPAEVPQVVAAPIELANLEIVFKNRLRSADFSVWIDEEKVLSREVSAPKNIFKRTVGRNVFALIPLTEGPHVIDVRLIGVEGKVDVVRRTEAEFVSGETKRLKVAVIPPRRLKLSWAPDTNG